jgi:hypothetical protein
MDKGIGFSRAITLDWLDATASLCQEGYENGDVRARLVSIIENRITGKKAQQNTIGVLSTIWINSKDTIPRLRSRALELFKITTTPEDRLWLHYGMTMTAYPFFRLCAAEVGKMGRLEEVFTIQSLRSRVSGELGHLGSIDTAIERVVRSLKEWGLIVPAKGKGNYSIRINAYDASIIDLEIWLLACALYVHPSTQLPFGDLLRLAELYPFRLTVAVDHLRKSPMFDVNLQGGRLEMVQLVVE